MLKQMRKEELEARRLAARRERDSANRELRSQRAGTIAAVHVIARALVEEYRLESRKRRDWVRDSTSLESYLTWQVTSATQVMDEVRQDAVGEILKLAQAELRLVIANDTVCALNRELTRVVRRKAGINGPAN
jgi:hypothetical protein